MQPIRGKLTLDMASAYKHKKQYSDFHNSTMVIHDKHHHCNYFSSAIIVTDFSNYISTLDIFYSIKQVGIAQEITLP